MKLKGFLSDWMGFSSWRNYWMTKKSTQNDSKPKYSPYWETYSSTTTDCISPTTICLVSATLLISSPKLSIHKKSNRKTHCTTIRTKQSSIMSLKKTKSTKGVSRNGCKRKRKLRKSTIYGYRNKSRWKVSENHSNIELNINKKKCMFSDIKYEWFIYINLSCVCLFIL